MHSVLPHSPRSSWWRLQFNWVWLGRWGSFFRIISSQRLQYLYRRLCAVLSRSVLSDSLQPHGLYWLLCPWGFSRQEYWSALPCPPSGELPNPEFKPRSAALRVDSLSSEPPGKPINRGYQGCLLPGPEWYGGQHLRSYFRSLVFHK